MDEIKNLKRHLSALSLSYPSKKHKTDLTDLEVLDPITNVLVETHISSPILNKPKEINVDRSAPLPPCVVANEKSGFLNFHVAGSPSVSPQSLSSSFSSGYSGIGSSPDSTTSLVTAKQGTKQVVNNNTFKGLTRFSKKVSTMKPKFIFNFLKSSSTVSISADRGIAESTRSVHPSPRQRPTHPGPESIKKPVEEEDYSSALIYFINDGNGEYSHDINNIKTMFNKIIDSEVD